MSDTNTAALVAAIETLGAEIVSLRGEVQWYADRAAEREAENDRLREQLAQATQDDALPTWASVQRLMVKSGVDAIGRGMSDALWYAYVTDGTDYHARPTLAEAATEAANAWAQTRGEGRA